MKRYHMTKEDRLDLSRKYTQRTGDLKPKGLWYSIENEWAEWVKYNMPHWAERYNLQLVLKQSNILVIDSMEKLVGFQAQYEIGMETRTSLGFVMVDWERVAENYSGIEIRNYYQIKGDIMKDHKNLNRYLWFTGWDVPSGCIWNLSEVDGYVVKESLENS